MSNLSYTPEQLPFIIQFQHPEKVFPDKSDTLLASLLNIDVEAYRQIKTQFHANAYNAAQELLNDQAFAQRIDQLPFAANATVVGLGDSITDDYQSWLEILRHLLALRRPQDKINVINAGVSGDTTSQMISRFLDVVNTNPDWIICYAGTNDARLHGQQPSKTLVSLEETAKNYAMLRNFARTQTSVQWVWMTVASVIEERLANHWFMNPLQLMWRNKDMTTIADLLRSMPEPVVDLQATFGIPGNPAYLLDDGLHPSLTGQKAIVRALVERLSE